MRAHLGWKHHEAPLGEYHNSTPSPHGWERQLTQARGPTHREVVLVGSTMKHNVVNITTPPPPPMDGEVLNPIQTGLFWSICDWGGSSDPPSVSLEPIMQGS